MATKPNAKGSDAGMNLADSIELSPELRYSRDHVWVMKVPETTGLVLMGFTEIVAGQFTRVRRVAVPSSFDDAEAGACLGRVEGDTIFGRDELSLEFRAPLSGSMGYANPKLIKRILRRGKPELLRRDPYGKGYVAGLIGFDEREYGELMDAPAYREHLRESLAKATATPHGEDAPIDKEVPVHEAPPDGEELIDRLHLPDDRLYTLDHMWVQGEDSLSRRLIGFTEILANRFSEIGEVELHDDKSDLKRGQVVGVVRGRTTFEPRDIVHPVRLPVAGTVGVANELFRRTFLRKARPHVLSSDPYGKGWLYLLSGDLTGSPSKLLTAEEYRDYLKRRVREDPEALIAFKGSEHEESSDGGVFVSYRHADSSDWSRRTARTIEKYYGPRSVFLDLASGKIGRDYRHEVDDVLERADVVLVVIGPHYLEPTESTGRPRIEEKDDLVRAEVRAALEGDSVVCPVLVGGAALPDEEDLPEDIRELVFRQARTIESQDDLEQLAADLRPDLRSTFGEERDREGLIPRPIAPTPAMYARARTAITLQLIEAGWEFDTRVGEGFLGHPEFEGMRFAVREREGQVWLEEYKRRRLNRNGWARVHGFPISLYMPHGSKLIGMPKALKRAAANPLVYLAEAGRLPDDRTIPVVSRLLAWRRKPPMNAEELHRALANLERIAEAGNERR